MYGQGFDNLFQSQQATPTPGVPQAGGMNPMMMQMLMQKMMGAMGGGQQDMDPRRLRRQQMNQNAIQQAMMGRGGM